MNIKQIFINTNLFIDNKYLDNYCNLILENLETLPIKFRTQEHHILPRHVFKVRDLEVDESSNNKVHLLFRDHILAHYYLALCSRNDQIQFYNELAILRMIGDSDLTTDDKTFIENLENYQSLYEHACRCNSEAHKGKPSWNKGLRYHIGPMAEERKQNISKAAKGRYKNHIFINNGDIEKHIDPSDFEKYYAEGFIKGRLETTKVSLSKAQKANPNRSMLGKHQSDYQKECARLAKLGKPVSQESRNKMREAKLDKMMVSNYKLNVSKFIKKDQLQEYLDKGFVLGKLKKNK